MTFDEQHGWVERGTPGHYASAQVVDVDAEVTALDRIHARPVCDDPHAVVARRLARFHTGFDVVQGGGTAMTTYRVEGDTLRIVHNVQLPVRAQAVDVTIGDE